MRYGLVLFTLASIYAFGNQGEEPREEEREEECEEEEERKFSVYGDFLYWKSNVDGTELATISGPSNQRIVFLNGEWEPGFRVGVSYEFGCDEWGIDLRWTYYHGKSEHKTVSINSTQKLFADWNDLIAIGATSASGHWNVKLNLLDLNLGKKYEISEKVSLEPFVGIRAEWFDLDFHARYFGGAQTTAFDGDQDLKAIGIRMGSGAHWQVWCNFGIYAEISAALLSEKSDIKESFVTLNSDTLPLPPIKYKPKGVHTDLEIGLGLTYWYDFCCINSRLSLLVGYEFAKFFNLNGLFAVRYGPVLLTGGKPSKFEYNHGGDIDFQGLTVRAGLEF